MPRRTERSVAAKPSQLVAEERRIGDRVRVQTDQLEVRKLLGQLCFQVLGTGPEAGQLGRAADRAAVRRVGREAAVVAVEPSVAVEGEGDVTLVAAEGLTAGATMDRRCHSAAVQEEHGLAAVVREQAELGEERRRERVARLTAQVDDLDRRERPNETLPQLESLEPLPALGPGRRRSVEDDRILERTAFGRDRARVVARVGFLLVGRVLLLVDDDQTEALDRGEDRRAGSDDHARVPGCDPLALVPPLRLGQGRMQDGHSITEARPEAAECLRSECDLRYEHDRAEALFEGGLAGSQIDLRLAAPGLAVEEVVRRPAERSDHLREHALLCLGQRVGTRFADEILCTRPPLRTGAPLAGRRRYERECPGRGGAVVIREPERQVDERLRDRAEHLRDRDRLDVLGHLVLEGDDHTPALGAPECDRDDRPAARARRPGT